MHLDFKIVFLLPCTPRKHFYFFSDKKKKKNLSVLQNRAQELRQTHLKSPAGGRGGTTGCSLRMLPSPEGSCTLGPPNPFPSESNISSSLLLNNIT